MRFLIALMLVGAAAAGGWYWYRGRQAPEVPGSMAESAAPPVEKSPSLPEAPPPKAPPAETKPEIVSPAELIRQGERLMGEKRHADAGECFKKAMAGDPTDPAVKKAASLLYPIALGTKDLRWELTCKWRLGRADAPGWKRLDELNTPLFGAQPSESPVTEVHVVQKGDTLGKIARNKGTTVECLRLLNRKRNDTIFAGERLKVLPLKGRMTVEISKSSLELYLLYDGALLKKYPVGIGRDNKTPEGAFTIENRIENPPWWKERGKEPIPAGHPDNILGTRWLGFAPPYADFAIHGTTKPDTIGKKLSDGCIRMRNEEVEELFAFCPTGTPVRIFP